MKVTTLFFNPKIIKLYFLQDMFADNFDKDKQAAKDLELAKQKEEEETMNLDEVVKWQFRWENKDDAEVHGPHTSEEMLKWQVIKNLQVFQFIFQVNCSTI